jgi:hypothetical protein
VVALAGCTANPQKQLERVAKDWSMTIRASQVMPIYPLEEDLRPGDLYLSTRTMDSEIETWNQRGFLPLVNRFARIQIPISDYNKYFENAAGDTKPPSFQRLPKAAFPSYSFEVDNRGSLGLALPLGSVPVALALAGAQSAMGSVVLKKATTQGLPDMEMDKLVDDWSRQNENKHFLALEATKHRRPLILRAITRVFSIGGADVSLTFQKAISLGVDAGAAPAPPELLSASEEDFEKRISELQKNIATLKQPEGDGTSPQLPGPADEPSEDPEIANLEAELRAVELLKARADIDAARRSVEQAAMTDQFGGFLLPGGAARIASRSTHGVSMKEDFDKPLVVGYWAREYLVLNDGSVISVGNLQQLVDDPDAYRSRVLLTQQFIKDGPPEEGTRFKPNMQLPDRTKTNVR